MAVTLRENRQIRNAEVLVERPDGTLVPVIPHPTPLRNAEGELVGAINVLVDVSERKQAETNQNLLLKELNHRVKNNMQMLQSLLNAAQRETSDTQARASLRDATGRLAAMAAAQKVLYEEGKPTSFQSRDFIEAVCAAASSAFHEKVLIELDVAEVILPNDVAMPLALILNELLTNAVKHGITVGDIGRIRVAFNLGASGEYQLCVEDEGPGFDYDHAVRRRSSGLGLVSGLAHQIGGDIRVERGNGARCIVRFLDRGTSLATGGSIGHSCYCGPNANTARAACFSVCSRSS
jgi:two-component sensor histidine kinase